VRRLVDGELTARENAQLSRRALEACPECPATARGRADESAACCARASERRDLCGQDRSASLRTICRRLGVRFQAPACAWGAMAAS